MQQSSIEKPSAEILHNGPLEFGGGHSTRIHAVRYPREAVIPRIVVFDHPTRLYEWCQDNEIDDAINGGFTLNHRSEDLPTVLLGNYRINGRHLAAIPFPTPRSGVHINEQRDLSIIHRDYTHTLADGDFFQAGPMLVREGEVLVSDIYDFEGVALPPLQMDDDWTKDRYPRSAIGVNEHSIVTVSCNGYSPPEEVDGDRGMTLAELALFMAGLGVKDALNLDGGSKSTHIAGGKVLNNPRGGLGDNYQYFDEGLPLLSAIVFEKQSD